MEDITRARKVSGWLVVATGASLIGLGAYTLTHSATWYVWLLWGWWAVLAGVTAWAVVQTNRAG